MWTEHVVTAFLLILILFALIFFYPYMLKSEKLISGVDFAKLQDGYNVNNTFGYEQPIKFIREVEISKPSDYAPEELPELNPTIYDSLS